MERRSHRSAGLSTISYILSQAVSLNMALLQILRIYCYANDDQRE